MLRPTAVTWSAPEAPVTRVVIGGLPRCGTTLLASLIHQQPGARFVTDYVRWFLVAMERLGVGWRTRLSLSERRVTLALARDEWLRHRHVVAVGLDDFGTVDELHRLIARELRTHGERAIGHKTVLTPGALDALLEGTDIRVVVLVRDPRDAVLSFWHRTGTDAERYIAQWNAMARYALTAASPRFRLVRYEDLVASPRDVLASMSEWWRGEANLPDRLSFARGDRRREVAWTDNSAFGALKARFDSAPVGRWRERRSSPLVRYAAVNCAEVAERLGYAIEQPRLGDRLRFSLHELAWSADHRLAGAVENLRHRVLETVAPRLRG